jgi:TonB family protein
MVVRFVRVVTGLALVAGMMTAPSDVRAQDPKIPEHPHFTPYTLKPELRNAPEVTRQLAELYPPLLRDAGIGGTAIYWLYIDYTGEVRKVQLFRSSGYEALDAAAGRVASAMAFSPAMNRDRAVNVWVQVPVTFATGRAGAAGALQETRRVRPRERTAEALPPPPARRAVARSEIIAAPMFTPYTEKPELRNGEETARALQRNYPPLLRDAGIGGTATVWFLIDEEGVVVRSELAKTSGYEALDVAALTVAETMEFLPARNRGEPVLVWVQIPVSFSSK